MKGVKLVPINLSPDIAKAFKKHGFENENENDGSSPNVNLDFYLSKAEYIPVRSEEEKETTLDWRVGTDSEGSSLRRLLHKHGEECTDFLYSSVDRLMCKLQ